MLPKTTVAVEDEAQGEALMRLIDALEDNDDVQEVYANFDIPEQVLEAVTASDPELCLGEARAVDARLDLREGGVAGGRDVVAERREAAVVGRAKPVERDELGRLEHAVADLLRRLDPRVDRVDDADEDPLVRTQVLAAIAAAPAAVGLARELEVEAPRVELEQSSAGARRSRRRRCGSSRGRRRAGVDADPLALLVA